MVWKAKPATKPKPAPKPDPATKPGSGRPPIWDEPLARIHAPVPVRIKEALKARAQADGVAMNTVIIAALEAYFEGASDFRKNP